MRYALKMPVRRASVLRLGRHATRSAKTTNISVASCENDCRWPITIRELCDHTFVLQTVSTLS